MAPGWRSDMKLSIPILLTFICMAFSASGQQPPSNGSPCPTGMIPGYGRCYSPTDPELNGQMVKPASPLWQDRFGAIALDVDTGSIGWVSGARSRREAANAAIADCGGGGCEVHMEGRNTCLAVASGGRTGFARDVNVKVAEASAVEACRSLGGTTCEIRYSACSLPVRIR